MGLTVLTKCSLVDTLCTSAGLCVHAGTLAQRGGYRVGYLGGVVVQGTYVPGGVPYGGWSGFYRALRPDTGPGRPDTGPGDQIQGREDQYSCRDRARRTSTAVGTGPVYRGQVQRPVYRGQVQWPVYRGQDTLIRLVLPLIRLVLPLFPTN